MGRPAGRKFAGPAARRICAGGIHFRRAFKISGFPQNARILWADAKQLDDLSIAVTRMEETAEEE